MTEGGGQGDLGRRIMRRRQELGLSREQVADRARMSPGFVEYVETSAAAGMASSTLFRLAAVLDTTVDALLGGGIERPPGSGRASPRPSFEALDPGECRRLLDHGGVGRFVFVGADGPVAVPVNFRMDGDDVVFRTAVGSSLDAVGNGELASFEVDHVDDAMSEGWSVLLHGHVTRDADRFEGEGRAVHWAEPWAGGDRPVVIRLVGETMTGRRVRSGA